jgi:hypothetical protein
MNKKDSNSQKQRSTKKKIGWFYKISLSCALMLLIVLSYFIVLVSSEPKSIPYVSNKIVAYLKEKVGEDSSAGATYVNFTRYGTVKLIISNLKISYQSPGDEEKQQLSIPTIEGEFSLFRLLFLNLVPTKVKIINSEIVIDNTEKLPSQNTPQVNHLPLITKFLTSIRKEEFPIKFIEIENARLLIKDGEEIQEIVIKYSKFNNSWKGGEIGIVGKNKISFSKEKSDVEFNSTCQLSENDYLKCDLLLENLILDSIANLHPKLNELAKIKAKVNLAMSFATQGKKIMNINFRADAKNGSFEFTDFFSQKIEFSNFSIKGEYDHAIGALNLSDILLDFASSEAVPPQLSMSLLIFNLKSDLNKKLDFNIKIQNAGINELEKFWPSALNQNGVRAWVIGHIKNGIIKDSYAKFSLICDEEKSILDKIDAQVMFKGLDLSYDEAFPGIAGVSGVASFSKEKMNIEISQGSVLNSEILDSQVSIDNFNANKILLRIAGKTQGHAADSLKHIDHKSDFVNNDLIKYINGDSQNSFNLVIPLQDNLALKDTYISVKSQISNLDNEYVKGAVNIISTKDFSSNNFISNINLNHAQIKAKAFDVTKEVGVESNLSFIVAILNPKNVAIKDILLWKKEVVKNKEITSKISGNLAFKVSPFILSSLNIKNSNFGNNDYEFTYSNDRKLAKQKINLKGQKINFGNFITNNPFKGLKSKKLENLQFQVAVNNVDLLENKELKNFYFSINCKNGFCNDGLLNGIFAGKKAINLRMTQSQKDNFALVTGNIGDVGYLAEALGISKLVSMGSAKVKLKNKLINGGQVIGGELDIDSDITIYENDKVKKFESDDLFSQIKDKIFSEGKTTFDSMKLDFEIKDNVLNINSLIANNYKVGITAKGFVNLGNNSYELKGMIVPGFIINNLFGIGNIPILGGVISGLLTGGEGGGLFGIRYEYIKKPSDKEGVFKTYKVSAFVPATIQNLFE